MKNTKFISIIGTLIVVAAVVATTYAFQEPANAPTDGDSSAGSLLNLMAGNGFASTEDSLHAIRQKINGITGPAHQWVGTSLQFRNSDGTWGASTDLKGPVGAKGSTGPQGPVGPQGIQGIPGTSGTSSWTDGTGKVTTAMKVGIGKTNPAYELDVAGTIHATYDLNIQRNAALGGYLLVGTNVQNPNPPAYPGDGHIKSYGPVEATAFQTTSDARLKKDVRTLDNSLEKILQLRGVSYKWKDASLKDNDAQIGVIAQEVEKVYPEVVETGKDGYKSVEYGNLIAPLIEAVKTQQAEIESLKVEINNLKVVCK
ncbi:MAG: tail fiber domain-containing protein [Patescibacteria group bacterium]|nr:tail fiber domain-containing protein [Patescibacteria group bacterium]